MRIFKPFHRFRRDDDGTITMEFAIVAPLLFTVLIGGYEFFDAYKSYGRAAKVTYTLGDIVSRQVEIQDDKVTELFALMEALLPWMNGDKTLRISSITYTDDDGYEVDWSKRSDKTLSLNEDFELGGLDLLTTEYQNLLPTIASGDSVILVETSIPHRTLVSMFGLRDLVWRNQIAVRPRFVSKIPDVTVTVTGGSGSGESS